MKIISIADVKFIAFRLAKEYMTFNEPIPDFTTRFPNILESCVVTPFQMFNQKPLYKGLTGKSSNAFLFNG